MLTKTEKSLKKSDIKSIGSGILNKFIVSSENFIKEAYYNDIEKIYIDLIQIKVIPKFLNSERNVKLIKNCKENLNYNFNFFSEGNKILNSRIEIYLNFDSIKVKNNKKEITCIFKIFLTDSKNKNTYCVKNTKEIIFFEK